MAYKKLSVVIPCYNESSTLEKLVGKVLDADVLGLDLEIVIVNDGSDDGSTEICEKIEKRHPLVKTINHPRNLGKGAALRTGFGAAQGDIIAIQDADLEYSPTEFPRLLDPIITGRADVVYGSRFSGGEAHRVLYFWHRVGNSFLTLISNIFANVNLTDMESCYKVFTREILEKITIKENRFGFEPEITAKICHLVPRPRIYEVGISYSGRTYQEGKKVGWKDGVRAIYCILRYNFFD